MAARGRRPDFDLSSELEFEEYSPRLRAQTPRLRSDTEIVPQTFRGKQYFVLQDPATLQFYRVGPVEREILAQLDGQTTLGEIHERLRRKFAGRAPSFQDLGRFVHMLRHANLTVPDPAEEARWGVQRAAKKRKARLKQKLASFMYLTIPILDPDRFLAAALPYVRWIFSMPFLVLWLGVVGTALVTFSYHFEALTAPANGILAPDNLIWLWVAFVLIKACHEFGHAFAAGKQGAEVHRMGIMFLIFMPVLYVDTTPVWAVPGKWRKVLVGSAGMMTELFIASLALFAWLSLEPGLLRTVLYNMIFIASVSTLLFNGNPLLRYDAYYILADLVEIPNLRQRSTQYILYLMRRYLVGERVPPATASPREKAWFVVYGVLATAYRCFIVVAILLFIASKLFAVGVAMATVVAVLWVVTPLVKLLNYVFLARSTRPVRLRAVGVFLVVVGGLAYLLGGIPATAGVRTPCALEPYEQRVLRAEWAGFFARVHVKDGDRVQEGQILAELTNEELDFSIQHMQRRMEALAARIRMLETRHQASAQAQKYRMEMLRKDLELLRQRKASLTVRAPFGGQIIAPELARTEGRFLNLGDPLFAIASLDKLRVVAVVSDADVPAVRAAQDEGVRIKFASAPDRVYMARVERVHPSATHAPPPAALSNAAGGEVLLDPHAPQGQRTLLPWYRVDLILLEAEGRPPVGATGTARFLVGQEPLGMQMWLRFRRMLHRRFLI
ncbi:MAG: efflux RND transporter periplasmic adaptor subunit [Planctomycetota bacterium]|jgi:putative peptide zinc metalloprotease protein